MSDVSQQWIDREAAVLMSTYTRLPIVAEHGHGSELWDVDGRRYLDFLGGIATNSLGHTAPAVVDAMKLQLDRLIHTSNLIYTEPMIELAELLVANSCLDRVFFANSGAEANEGAIKLARRFGTLHRNGAYDVISATNSFHGRTLATLTASGKAAFHAQYDPLPAGFSYVPWNDVEALQRATSDRTVAVLLEPIQGEGGVNLPDPGYFPAVRDWCDANGLLLILDEVQTGIGRTGTLFAYEWLGIEPDIMTLAKGLGGGIVIGALLARASVSVFGAGDHGTTFGGNALACAGGLAVVRSVIERDLPAEVAKRGSRMQVGLREIASRQPAIIDVRGRGLLLAVQFSTDVAADVVNASLERGLIVNAVQPHSLRLVPPLTVSAEEVEEALGILEAAVGAVCGELVPVAGQI